MKLRDLRRKSNMTQATIAEIIGCSTVTYNRYETGNREVPVDVLITLSKLYNESIDYIVENPYSKDFVSPEPISDERKDKLMTIFNDLSDNNKYILIAEAIRIYNMQKQHDDLSC